MSETPAWAQLLTSRSEEKADPLSTSCSQSRYVAGRLNILIERRLSSGVGT